MKKLATLLLLAALLLTAVPAAQAATQPTRPACTYEDADNDGLCDRQKETCGRNFADKNQNAPRSHRQERPRHGQRTGCGRR